uniref:AlNc14C228G9259 protein n=1 Tax=Albugo laibachii Nc14 TaxID=890382 RepID=F0WSC0_9STRA|nr:AlNc14C228G9259 [Albugo laibachii Nc14]|eukprot:CCA24239.1 AlNc14C228G9259 [Albugo laibachii Nc14]
MHSGETNNPLRNSAGLLVNYRDNNAVSKDSVRHHVNVDSSKIKMCRRAYRCHRIQIVPDTYCSVHRAIMSMSPADLERHFIKSSDLHTIPKNSIPVGVWPPIIHRVTTDGELVQSYRNTFTPSGSNSNTNIWPSYDRIAFILFKSVAKDPMDCVGCLIQHSEVFFVFTGEQPGFSGYVWMRQAPAHVLQRCLEKDCSSLTYDTRKHTIKRPIGLRPWTIADI